MISLLNGLKSKIFKLQQIFTGFRHTKKTIINSKNNSLINTDLFKSIDWSLHSKDCRGSTLVSSLCRYEHLDGKVFRSWLERMKEPWRAHRKLWELAYICETLDQRGMLQFGKRGLGFAVGAERLPSFFASLGCEITATDLGENDPRAVPWSKTGQWSGKLERLNAYNLCPNSEFMKRVSFRAVDMNHIPDDLLDYDFTWSTCSFEHCGSIQLGLNFLEKQLNCLRPGGVAVHTTEFNLTSNSETISDGGCVIFRLKDLEEQMKKFKSQGHSVEPFDISLGNSELDKHVDFPPYSENAHLRLCLYDKYAVSSIGLIITKSK